MEGGKSNFSLFKQRNDSLAAHLPVEHVAGLRPGKVGLGKVVHKYDAFPYMISVGLVLGLVLIQIHVKQMYVILFP